MWIEKSLDINYPDEPISSYSYLADTKNVKEVCNLIEAFGTGITGFKMVEVPAEKILSHLSKPERDSIVKKIENMLSNSQKSQERHMKGIDIIPQGIIPAFGNRMSHDNKQHCQAF